MNSHSKRGDKLDIPINDLSYIKDFSTGQRSYVDTQAALTLERFEAGDATGAIVEGSKLTAIPQQSSSIINLLRTRAAIASLVNRSTDSELTQLAHSTYPNVPEIIPQTIERARLLLYGHEIVEWTFALQRFNDAMEFHGAAISALELAHTHPTIDQDQPQRLSDEQRSLYTIAADSARHHISQLSDDPSNQAERRSTRTRLVAALRPQVDHYLTHDRLTGQDRSNAINGAYELDDNTQLTDDYLKRVYELFLQSTRMVDMKSRRFFAAEIASANDRIEQDKLRAKGRSYFVGFDTHRPPKRLRPKPRT